MSARVLKETSWVGQSIPRREDGKLVRGEGAFTDDFNAPGQLYCEILRSTVPHARIKRVDVRRALEIPGVVLAVSGEQAKPHWTPLPRLVGMMNLRQPYVYALAVDKVYYQGEPVAAVAAESRYAAEDALAAIEVEYEELPVVLTREDSLGSGATPPRAKLYADWDDNLQVDWSLEYGHVEKAFAEADLVLQDRIWVQRYSGMPMEARAVLSEYRPREGELVVRLSTQIPHQSRSIFATMFNLPETRIQTIAGDVGGGYGNKTQVDAETIPVLLSILARRPVKWTEHRRDWLISGPGARDYSHDIEVAFRRDGTILAVRDRLYGDMGCDGAVRSDGLHSLLVGGMYVPGPYKIENYKVHVQTYVTNKAPYGAYRGFGKDTANVAMETMIHRAAARLGLDPIAVRKRNLISSFPHKIVTGPVIENCSFIECLDALPALMDLPALRRRKEEARRQGRWLGIGVVSMLEPSGMAAPMSMFSGFETASVRMAPDGSVLVLTGIQNIGQGMETAFAQVAADRLGCTPADVRVVCGDTKAVPYGLGSFSSRGATYGVTAVYHAADQVRDKLLKAAANMLEAAPGDLQLGNGHVWVAGSDRSLTIKEVVAAIYFFPGPYTTLPGETNPIPEGNYVWTNPAVKWEPDEAGRIQMYPAHACGAQGALVEVDIETGVVRIERLWGVHDIGTMINPKIVEGQLVGAVIQGVGGTMSEKLYYDERGNMITTTLTGYDMPNFLSAPPVQVEHLETPSPITPLGTKGVGEGGCIATPTVIRLAVEDALSELGVAVSEAPLTPPRVLAMIEQARARAGA